METNIQNAIKVCERVFGNDVIWHKYTFDMPLIYSNNFLLYKFIFQDKQYLLLVGKNNDVSTDLIKNFYEYIKNNNDKNVLIYLSNRRVFNELHRDVQYVSFDGKYQLDVVKRAYLVNKIEYTKATQLVVKYLLLFKDRNLSTRHVAEKIGLSNTTVKRAYDFLEEVGGIVRSGIQTSNVDYSIVSKPKLLKVIKDYLIFPYHRSIRLFLNQSSLEKYKDVFYISGENALSKYTELGEMDINEYAVSSKVFDQLIADSPNDQDGELYNIEDFIYDPKLFANKKYIDIIDTYIIITNRYKNNGNPRIKQAIKELERKIVK